ncbi:MAG: hypothetical protein AB8G05_14265 [Oligoflexales bacterium]
MKISILLCYLILFFGTNCLAELNDYTFGWELEFSAGKDIRKNQVVTFANRKQTKYNFEELTKPEVNVENYPFLRPYGSIEQSGNIEIHSYVTRGDLNKVISQMHETIDGIHADNNGLEKHEWRTKGSKVASVHLHFRFDKSKIALSHREFTAWVSRLTDLVVGWRFEKTSRFTALKKRTQVRNPPHYTSLRGAVRLTTDDLVDDETYRGDGSQYDIEIRGHLYDVDAIKETVNLIIAGIENPNSLQGFYDHQILFFNQTKPLSSYVSAYAEVKGKFLSTKELGLIDKLARASVYSEWWGERRFYSNSDRSILPIMGLEYAPYFTGEQRESIKQANNEFYEGVYNFVKNPNLDLSFTKHREFVFKKHKVLDRFRKLLCDWAHTVKMWKIFKESLYTNEIRDPEQLQNDPNYYKWLLQHLSHAEPSVFNILRKIDEATVKSVYLNDDFTKDQRAQLVEAFRNAGKSELYFYAEKIVHQNARDRNKRQKKGKQQESKSDLKIEIINFNDHEGIDHIDLYLDRDKYSVNLGFERFVSKFMLLKGWKKPQTKEKIIARFENIGLSNAFEVYHSLENLNTRIKYYNNTQEKSEKLFSLRDIQLLQQAYIDCIRELLNS